VVCRTDPAAGADDALAVIAVPGSAPGISVIDVYDKIGHRGVVTPRVHFDAVRVPAADSCTTSSATPATTPCSPPAAKPSPRWNHDREQFQAHSTANCSRS
jgi:hypothetical protein